MNRAARLQMVSGLSCGAAGADSPRRGGRAGDALCVAWRSRAATV